MNVITKNKTGVVVERNGEYLTDEWFLRWNDDISKAVVFNKESIISPRHLKPYKEDLGRIHQHVNYDELDEAKLVEVEIKTEYKINQQ